MAQQTYTTPIDTNSLYVIRGQTILDILYALKSTIPCAFNSTVTSVESMLAQVQPIVPQQAPEASSAAVAQSKPAPVVPMASPVPLEMVEGGAHS